MRQIKLYLDEDVNPLLAKDLRQRGYDALATSEAGNVGLSERDQFEFARGQGRAFPTHNRDDFLQIARANMPSISLRITEYSMCLRCPTANSFSACCTL
jgi:predicted nuclease of predicted toxin-antitoxin system